MSCISERNVNTADRLGTVCVQLGPLRDVHVIVMSHSFAERPHAVVSARSKQLSLGAECMAPEVDHDLLLLLVRRELAEEAASLAFRLIYSFESWRNAHADLIAEEFRRTYRPSCLL